MEAMPEKKVVKIEKFVDYSEVIGAKHLFNLSREKFSDDNEIVINAWKNYLEKKKNYEKFMEGKKVGKNLPENILKFLVTFTASEENKNITADEAMKCLKKCVNSKKQKILQYYGALELTKKGRIHAHLCITFDVFEAAKNKEGWGQNFFKKCSGWNYGTINVKRVMHDNGVCTYIKKDQSIENPLPCIGEPF